MNPKTYSAKASELSANWYVVDAEGVVLGRLATEVAQILRGKFKPTFTPHMNGGDYVIVINASKIAVTGKRLEDKMYYRHSQYPGGLKTESLGHLLARKPQAVIERAVRGMLPHTRLGDDIMGHLKVYPGTNHPHQAQKPVPWSRPRADASATETPAATTTESATEATAEA